MLGDLILCADWCRLKEDNALDTPCAFSCTVVTPTRVYTLHGERLPQPYNYACHYTRSKRLLFVRTRPLLLTVSADPIPPALLLLQSSKHIWRSSTEDLLRPSGPVHY